MEYWSVDSRRGEEDPQAFVLGKCFSWEKIGMKWFSYHSITPVLQKAVIFARDVRKAPLGANQSQVLWAWILYHSSSYHVGISTAERRAGPDSYLNATKRSKSQQRRA
jgi:hypothetical protein